ncbi:MAG: EutN/CcmL family microcompartment protein [Synergistaceae bacterium]|nr:EutN/CcmL family microcompartment protein [Synergistaceae bacterium]
MYLAKVIGTVVSTSKNEALIGMKFLIVERLTGRLEVEGRSEVAVDSVGAGTGELVLVCEGSSARCIFGANMPVDKAIVGIVDTVEVE